MTIDVAIVGMGCRFPGGATDAGEFWDFLVGKGDGIVDVPEDRWSLDRFYDPDPDAPGRMYVKRGGFLTQQSLWDFDPEFFGISPREAAIMDPQQRLVLEVAVEAIDDAGLGQRVGGRDVGVYVGGFMADNLVVRHSKESRGAINSHTATSGTFTMLSNRLSYVLDLVGPSMTIDTACSSSLVAVHEAAQAVARGECEVALAGGVNAMLRPETFIAMCKGRFLAPDGRCKTFDAKADGYARGEGAGIIVLKPLAAAQADGDRVYAVIKATGANQDGRTSGITVPNPVSQARLAQRVLDQSGLKAEEIGYVEAHGTGTSIGDPLELEALGRVYGDVEGRHTPLVVGSVKAAIGHLEAAAGVAGVIKAALTVHHATITPQAWLEELNPAIPFDDYRVEIPTQARPFPEGYAQPAAAVNGFGYGGTNAHVVLTAAPPVTEPERRERRSDLAGTLLPVSGRTDAALQESAAALADQLEATADPEGVREAAWARRVHHPVRKTVSGATTAELVAQLRSVAAGEGRAPGRAVVSGERPVFVFSGMGPQWWRMGRDLLQRDGVFKAKAEEIDAAFTAITGWSIIEELLRDEDDSRVTRTEVAQPANFLVQVALAAELEALGVEPAAIVGHSVGEVSAAYVSGALSLHDALLVSFHRSRLQATTAGSGGMLAVGLPEPEVLAWLPEDGSVSVAAVNSPSSVTLAGETPVLEALAERFTEEGVFARALRVEVPYHSHLMDPILDEIRTTLAPLQPAAPTRPLWSSVTARPVREGTWGPDYWVANVREPVRFAATVEGLVADGHRVFLEVGPHPVLGGNVREILVRSGETGAVVSTLNRDRGDVESVQTALSELYAAGALDTAVAPGDAAGPTTQVALPAYPWQRARQWAELDSMAEDRLGADDALPMLAERTEAAQPEWQTALSATALPWLPDHVVDGLTVLPGAAYLDMALSAARALNRSGGRRTTLALADVSFSAPLVVDAHDVPVLRLAAEATTGGFAISSRAGEAGSPWTPHVTGRVVDGAFAPGHHDLAPPTDGGHVSGPFLYEQLDERGLSYGPAFQRIVEAWSEDDRLVASVDATGFTAAGHVAHPAVVDAALQCVAALVTSGAQAPDGPMVPFAMKAVRSYADLSDRVLVSVRRLPQRGLHADIAIADGEGRVLVEMLGVEFRPVRPAGSTLARLDPLWYAESWERIGAAEARPALAALEGSLLVVGDSAVAEALVATHPESRAVTVPTEPEALLGEEPAAALLEVERVLGELLDRAAGRVTLAVVPAPSGPLDQGPAAVLLATASAVQRVLDRRVLDGTEEAPDLHGVVVTEQAFGLPGDTGEVSLSHASLLGLRRTLRNEQPQLAWRLVDREAETAAGEFAAEVLRGPEDLNDEVALRTGMRLVTRFVRDLPERIAERDTAAPLTDPERGFAVEAPASLLLSDLALREVARREPGDHDVEVRLLSAGLNYKDAGKVMGLLGEKEMAGTYFGTSLGMEAIGTVVRVGSAVTQFAVGDRLSVSVRDSLKRYLTIDVSDPEGADGIDHAPSTWADTDSALILPFLTAQHSLADVARLEAGETVLVQGAAGGVGLAAIQVAKHLGARVIGTASNAERRAVVLAAGADEVLDSRSLSFVDDVRRLTGGQGVDVVLSSAPGEVIGANLEAAAEFGRVVEIGKSDIYGRGWLALGEFDRNLSFHAVDIDRLRARRRPVTDGLVDTVFALFESGDYVPLPTTVYPVSELGAAFEAVIRGSHTGRVVLDFTEDAPPVRPAVPVAPVHADAAYLVTGGFGDFGLATARWLADRGARHLVLAGRGGASSVAAKAAVKALEDGGVMVVEAVLDVSSLADVERLVAEIGPSLRGVFHAAGVLDDRPFTDVDAGSVAKVFGPKVDGGWHLHTATTAAGIDLDHFVVYSSASSITGNVPQATYAAANTALDSLVHLRAAAGQSGLSVNWGALSGGMAGSSEDVAKYLAAIGLGEIDLDLAARMLGEALALDVTQVGILDVDWARWGATHPMSSTTPRFADHIASAGASGSDAARLQAELVKLPEEQRTEVVAYMLAEQLAVVLGIPAESVDLDTALPDLGMDSLMAVELQARVNLALGIEVSALEFGRGGGLNGLAGRVLPALIGKDA